MPTIQVGVQEAPGGIGQVVNMAPRVSNVTSIVNNGSQAIEYSVNSGGAWTSVAAGASATPGITSGSSFRLRRGVAGGYPIQVTLTYQDASMHVGYDPVSGAIRTSSGAPAASDPVTVSGTLGVGNTLTATPSGGWTVTSGQWYRNGSAISGATAMTYQQVTADGSTALSFVPTGLPFRVNCGNVPAAPPDMNIGTRVLVPNGRHASNTTLQCRRVDYLKSDATSLRVRLPNFYYAFGVESDSGAAMTVACSVEYPIGSTPQVFLFSGANTGSIPTRSVLESDTLSLNVPYVKDTKIAFHTWASCSGRIIYNSTMAGIAGEDKLAAGVGTVTNTVATGGTGYGSDSNFTYGPIAVITQLATNSIGIFGDSNALGAVNLVTTANPASDQWGLQGVVGRALGRSLPVLNMGSYGDTATSYTTTANSTQRRALVQYCTHVISNIGINDITSGRTAVQLLADHQAIRNLFPTKPWYVMTLPPQTTGAWTAADGSDQLSIAQEAERVAYNTAVRAGLPWASGFFDLEAAVSQAGTPVKWKAPGFTVDGIHMTTTAQIAGGSAINASIFTG